MNLSNEDLVSEMVEDLRIGGKAIERNGYEVKYSVTSDRTRGFAEEPGEAMERYLAAMQRVDYVQIQMSPDVIINLFEEGSPEHVDNALNDVLSRIEGRIHVDDPDINNIDPVIQYSYVYYYPDIDGGHFELVEGTPYSDAYLFEFRDLLEQESLQVSFE